MNRTKSENNNITLTEAATGGVLYKKVFLKISQNSQKSTCVRVSFLISCRAQAEKRLWHRCFPVGFVKFSRTSFLQNTSRRLILHLLQNTTLVYYISFIEGTNQRFILVVYFDTPDIFFVILFIFDILGVSSDIYF